jgi:hypothetical protein
MTSTSRSRQLRGLVAAALVVAAGCGSGTEHPRVGQAAPSDQELRQLCDESYDTASARFAAAGEVAATENSLNLTGGEGAVECQGDAWTVGTATRVEMALIFKAVADPGDPADDYCETGGVTVNLPNSGFEEREFDGNPYCFSWYSDDRAHGASASYVDRSTEVFLVWNIESDGDPFDTATEIGSSFSAANDAVLAGIYEVFGEAA